MSNTHRAFEILKILRIHSDEEHPLTFEDIRQFLLEKELDMNRKTFYADIARLREVGHTINTARSNNFGYYIQSEPFSFAQAKLLVDAVQSSRFISKDMSNELIDHIASLTSTYQAGQLKSRLYVDERSKTLNKSVYTTVDRIQNAITKNRKIRFRYSDTVLNIKNERDRRYRHDGAFYLVSPYMLVWGEDNYYCVGHHEQRDTLSNFRIDRMDNVVIMPEPRISMSVASKDPQFNISKYAQNIFAMYRGYTANVTLQADMDVLSSFSDRFGSSAKYKRLSETRFEITVSVEVSPPFYAFIFQFGDKIEVIAPTKVVEEFKEHVQSTLKQYLKP
jgi:predicted DNA-binding transcriptional regulator YafY